MRLSEFWTGRHHPPAAAALAAAAAAARSAMSPSPSAPQLHGATTGYDSEEEAPSPRATPSQVVAAGGDRAVAVSPAAAVGSSRDVHEVFGSGLAAAECLIWMGDFNYRIAGTYGQVLDYVAAGKLPALLNFDQGRQEMAKGIVFHGLVG
jgi:hypothetical protein